MNQTRETEIMAALAEPIRLRIASLINKGELCVCDLTQILSLPQSTVSRHIARLRRAGVVLDRRQGKWIHYRLADHADPFWKGILQLLSGLSGNEPFRSDWKALLNNQSKCPITELSTTGESNGN
ncbi:MAG: metalloregulator ArsR/SmtB family transcription factor [bacterium]|nr:metalloregulator ArsR/SmtB family transcription factor [bacterium]